MGDIVVYKGMYYESSKYLEISIITINIHTGIIKIYPTAINVPAGSYNPQMVCSNNKVVLSYNTTNVDVYSLNASSGILTKDKTISLTSNSYIYLLFIRNNVAYYYTMVSTTWYLYKVNITTGGTAQLWSKYGDVRWVYTNDGMLQLLHAESMSNAFNATCYSLDEELIIYTTATPITYGDDMAPYRFMFGYGENMVFVGSTQSIPAKKSSNYQYADPCKNGNYSNDTNNQYGSCIIGI